MAKKTRNTFASGMREVIPTYDICTIKQDTFASDDLLVSGFASYLKTRPLLVKPHKHKFYHLVYFTKGSGTHTVDFVNFAVKPGEIYFMSPGQVHSWNFAGETDGYIVNFSETFFRSFLLDHRYLERFPFFSGVAERGVIFLNAAQQKQARDIFSGMLQALSLKDDFTDVSVKLLLLQLFILVERVEAGAWCAQACQQYCSAQLSKHGRRKISATKNAEGLCRPAFYFAQVSERPLCKGAGNTGWRSNTQPGNA